MIPLRAVALALVVSLAPLAGCVGGDEIADGTAAPKDVPDEIPEETPDGRGEFAAFKETNRTESGLGGRAHTHDYWQGRDRVEVMSRKSGMIPFPLLPPGAPVGTAIADYQPPPPSLVYEGTQQLEFLLTDVCVVYTGTTVRRDPAPPVDTPCVPHPAVNFRLHYLTSKDKPGEWRDAGRVVPGTATVIPVASDQVDMPHAVASLWVFRLFTEEPNGVMFNMTVTAVRGQDVARWPGHPDFYAERPSRVVFDGDAQTKAFGATQFLLTGDDTTWNHPEKLISYGTRELHVFVNVSRVESPVPPQTFFLDYHNASVVPGIQTFDPGKTRVYDEASDGTTFRFVIPVDDGGMDSPYQTGSRWGFRVLGEFGNDVVKGCAGIGTSCFPYSVDYHLTIVARGESEVLGAEGEEEGEG